jgi:hypothetical protein
MDRLEAALLQKPAPAGRLAGSDTGCPLEGLRANPLNLI